MIVAQPPKGFTLVEMMVVITIVLTMMILLAPMFQATTRTISTVDRKLAVYEAARNVLDYFEAELRIALVNERGQAFSIKKLAYMDQDSFTPGPNSPVPLVPGDKRFRESRREADCVGFAHFQVGAYRWNNSNQTLRPGSEAFPGAFPELDMAGSEFWRGSIRSTLAYRPPDDIEAYFHPTRTNMLQDVSLIESSMIFNDVHEYTRNSNEWQMDALPDVLGAGNETREMRAWAMGWVNQNKQSRIEGIRIMDLAAEAWDDGLQEFRVQPDNTIVYYAPLPKAIRVTITVCDREKRTSATLQRIVMLPVGAHNGSPGVACYDYTANDTYYKNATAPLNATNRTKYLPSLPSVLTWPRGWTTLAFRRDRDSFDVAPKPINWP